MWCRHSTAWLCNISRLSRALTSSIIIAQIIDHGWSELLTSVTKCFPCHVSNPAQNHRSWYVIVAMVPRFYIIAPPGDGPPTKKDVGFQPWTQGYGGCVSACV